jgi:anaerobic magnesium-protoporphyrin IX monomethyl ester cyclase
VKTDNIDIVLINPGDRKQIYQDLGKDYSAVEPPFWIAVIAAYLRKKKFSVAIIDSNAENIPPLETAEKIKKINPFLAAVIVYGSQPSASTQNMTISGAICSAIKDSCSVKVALSGLHPSALPKQTIEEERVDFVIEGEGPFTFEALLPILKKGENDFSNVPGLWFHDKNNQIVNTPRADLIHDLDDVLPIAAWDLLPMEKYKAHNWHCFDHINDRMPYGAIYTSLGCPYSCLFCCINAPFGKPGIRYRSPELVIEEIGILHDKYGIKNIKFVDELFVLDKKHYMRIVDLIIQKGYELNIWAYARVDSIHPEELGKMKKAGINWLALGIESANPSVRDGATKRMRISDIKSVVQIIQEAGIRVIGNFIFGLPDDTIETMKETLDLAIELNCEFINIYCAMAYPGSKLYTIAKEEDWELPKKWHEFSQHAYGMQPLPTKYISAKEVLKFRDEAFNIYFKNDKYLKMINEKFGEEVKTHIEEMSKMSLKRVLLEK